MFEFEDELYESSVSFSSSPPNRPFVADGSDLFRAVMEDLRQNSKLSHAIVDVMSKSDRGKSSSKDDNDKNTSRRYLCKRCLCDRTMCRCSNDNSKSAIHRVQWVDETYDKPLAVEQTISDFQAAGRVSPISQNADSVKPILKHKATCIIIVSE